MPWQLEYWGLIAALSTAAANTGSIVGRGRFTDSVATGWTGTANQTGFIAPQTVGAQTVAQTANGMNTTTAQNILVGCTVVTATGITSITTNELTCELLG